MPPRFELDFGKMIADNHILFGIFGFFLALWILWQIKLLLSRRFFNPKERFDLVLHGHADGTVFKGLGRGRRNEMKFVTFALSPKGQSKYKRIFGGTWENTQLFSCFVPVDAFSKLYHKRQSASALFSHDKHGALFMLSLAYHDTPHHAGKPAANDEYPVWKLMFPPGQTHGRGRRGKKRK